MVSSNEIGSKGKMSIQSYPLLLSLYKGEGRILIIPVINHIGGYSIDSDWFENIEDMVDYANIGENVFRALDFIKDSPVSGLTPKERELKAAWKKNSRYKSWISFWKNNNYALFKLLKDGHYQVYSAKRSEGRKGGYSGCVKKIDLPSVAGKEEIGKAIIDVFKAVEEYYQENLNYNPYPTKKLELLNGSLLTVQHPKDNHFNDYEDCHVAEIYQCYAYLPQKASESSAEFFLGTAPELDCNLDAEEIRSSWEDFKGKADFF